MAAGGAESGRIRRFFERLRNFLTLRQYRQSRKIYKQSTGKTPPADTRLPPSSVPPSPPTREPVAAPSRQGAPTSRGRDDILREQRRIEELRRIENEARAERALLEEKTAAQEPPIGRLEDFEPRKGFEYYTWFKAFGTFGDLKDMGDSPHLLGEMEELENMDVPAAFYSSTVLGKVKWKGRVEKEKILDELNSRAAWSPEDFRDIYPRWEYRYYVAESVGNVVVNIWEHKARQPLTRKAKLDGYKGN